MEFEIPDQFLEYKDLAVTRLQYLYPDLSIKASKKMIIVDLPHENTSIDLEKNLKKEEKVVVSHMEATIEKLTFTPLAHDQLPDGT